MNWIRTVLAASIVTGLLGGLVPNGVCQLIADFQTESCAMPCCKKADQPISCPLIRPDVPRDMIKVSPFEYASIKWTSDSRLGTREKVDSIQRGCFTSFRIPRVAFPSARFIWSTPQSIPAPPLHA